MCNVRATDGKHTEKKVRFCTPPSTDFVKVVGKTAEPTIEELNIGRKRNDGSPSPRSPRKTPGRRADMNVSQTPLENASLNVSNQAVSIMRE